jgi:hypothetical protein
MKCGMRFVLRLGGANKGSAAPWCGRFAPGIVARLRARSAPASPAVCVGASVCVVGVGRDVLRPNREAGPQGLLNSQRSLWPR